MANKEVREKFQYQKRVRETNERKIVNALAEREPLTWNGLRKATGISPPQLAQHLRRMTEQGKITHQDRQYFLSSEESNIFSSFNHSGKFWTELTISDPQNWRDQFSLAPFDEQQQRSNAKIVADVLADRTRFLLIKLLEFEDKGEEENAKLWTQTCLADTYQTEVILGAYLDGEASLTTTDGKFIEIYPGDGLVTIDSRITKPQTTKEREKLIAKLERPYKKPVTKAEIERRGRLRRRYLIDELRKAGNPDTLRSLEDLIDSARKTITMTSEEFLKKQCKIVIDAIDTTPDKRLRFMELSKKTGLEKTELRPILKRMMDCGKITRKGSSFLRSTSTDQSKSEECVFECT
ncbi:winged helix-turn-helix domain-containing protein, partial [Candidatus Bathyarchaeota archaeon]|nr:winged helix-turn-helix domain-containing protein [Candidatus Bathyarchaeota archaeon]